MINSARGPLAKLMHEFWGIVADRLAKNLHESLGNLNGFMLIIVEISRDTRAKLIIVNLNLQLPHIVRSK